MSLIERELQISWVKQDSVDIHPRGMQYSCRNIEDHHFFLKVESSGFKYQLCGRCGTIRIGEEH